MIVKKNILVNKIKFKTKNLIFFSTTACHAWCESFYKAAPSHISPEYPLGIIHFGYMLPSIMLLATNVAIHETRLLLHISQTNVYIYGALSTHTWKIHSQEVRIIIIILIIR